MLQKRGDSALFVAHRVAHDFSGVRCENKPDIEILEKGFQLGRWHVEMAQPLEELPEGGGFCLAGQGWRKGVHLLWMLQRTTHAREIAVVLDPLLIFGWLGFPRLELAGAAIAPFEGTGPLHASVRGVLASLPELAFVSIRKGTFEYVERTSAR